MNEGPPAKRKEKEADLLLGGLTRAQFTALRKEWYAKLKADGFNDAEWSDRNGNMNIGRDGSNEGPGLRYGYREGRDDIFHTTVLVSCTLEAATTDFETNRAYYTRCLQFLNSASRRRPKGHRQRAIWSLHAEGLTVRAIAEKVGVSKSVVHDTIDRCRILMGLWWSDTASQRDAELQARTEEAHDETKVPND